MLRECHRVLLPGGRMAALSITIPVGLGPEQARIVDEIGPPYPGGDSRLSDLFEQAGFDAVEELDRTEAYEETCAAIIRERRALERGLRVAEGDEPFDEELARKQGQLEAIRAGVLRRVLIRGRKAPL